MNREYRCHTISPGVVEGEALISTDAILFYQTDPKTGILTEPGHCLEGQCICNKLLVFPGGKGSSVVQADGMYKLDSAGTAPRGFIVEALDTVLVSSAIIMEMPMVDGVEPAFYAAVQNGDFLRLDTERQTITILDAGSH